MSRSLRSVPRAAAAVAASTVTAVAAGSAIAAAMGPHLARGFGPLVRGPEDLDLASLVAGYAVVCAALVALHDRVRPADWRAAALLGLVLGGAVFFGGHLVVVGWAHVPRLEMALAGVADPLAIGAAAVVAHAVRGRA